MQKLKGKLLYMGWFNLPWRLVTDDGDVDLWPIVEKFLTLLNGKRANQEQTRDSYILCANKSSRYKFKYIPGEYVLLKKLKGIGAYNVHTFLDTALCWLSGRLVEIEVEDGKQMKFTADASEEVFGVYFTANNSCKVPSGAEQTVCKIGERDCCIFLTASAEGFYCQKFNSSMAPMLLDRLAKGNIRASRIGNCALLGRKESEVATV